LKFKKLDNKILKVFLFKIHSRYGHYNENCKAAAYKKSYSGGIKNMKSRLSLILNTTKKKMGAALLCATLAATIGTGTVLASNSTNSLFYKVVNGVKSYSTDGGKTWSGKAPEGVTIDEAKDSTGGDLKGLSFEGTNGGGLAVRMENGVRSYSTDGGKTWSKDVPKGVTISEDGKKIKSATGTN